MVNIINHNIFNGIAGARPSYAPKYYILHNDAGSMSAESYISWLEDRYNNGKADLGLPIIILIDTVLQELKILLMEHGVLLILMLTCIH